MDELKAGIEFAEAAEKFAREFLANNPKASSIAAMTVAFIAGGTHQIKVSTSKLNQLIEQMRSNPGVVEFELMSIGSRTIH